ncbi:MAG: glycosyltransferase family 2 protein [Promicromonosporaceae bacterium]|nr:glycosyltransferase family 2 protein [Promicromonosporaceae bacterium]
MSPLISIVVPAYNAEDYLARALDSVVGFGPRVQVLVIDDGSADGTATLAQRYVARFPKEVQLIRKANGGHGSAINTGLAHATGTYLKVLDADDWFDREVFRQVLEALGGFVSSGREVDLLVTNFVYEKVGKTRKKVVHFGGALKPRRELSWGKTGRFAMRQYLMMHALTYRTQVLREEGLQLPERTFYVDSLFALQPLRLVQSLYYLDVNLYRYFIGRPDQSVQESVMLRRLDQQLRVNWLLLDYVSKHPVADRKLRRYRLHYVAIICAVTSVMLIRAGTPEALAQRDELWGRLRAQDPWLYRQCRFSMIGMISNLPGSTGRRVSIMAYLLAQRAIGFS